MLVRSGRSRLEAVTGEEQVQPSANITGQKQLLKLTHAGCVALLRLFSSSAQTLEQSDLRDGPQTQLTITSYSAGLEGLQAPTVDLL